MAVSCRFEQSVIEQSLGRDDEIDVAFGPELQQRLMDNGYEVNACKGQCRTRIVTDYLNVQYGIFPSIEKIDGDFWWRKRL